MDNPKKENDQKALKRRFSDDLFFLGFLALSLFGFFALVSFFPQDSSPYALSLPEIPVKNWCGKSGASLSGFLIYHFGLVAWFFPITLLVFAHKRFYRRHLFANTLLTICVLTVLATITAFELSIFTPIIRYDHLEFASAGAFGSILAAWAPRYIGPAGAQTLVAFFSLLCSLLLFKKKTLFGAQKPS